MAETSAAAGLEGPGAFRVGTRGSALATTQTRTVALALGELSDQAPDLVVIRTEGDVRTGSLASLGGTGVFASALREAVLDGRVDVAVHSLKDLPSAQPEGLVIACVPEREDVRDALCARDGLTLAELPTGARIGTGSPRRVAQLLAARPDLVPVDIRGNVQTRLARVPGLEHHDDAAPAAAGSPRGDLDAVVLACAGLDRLGMEWAITERLAPSVMLPAPGQGALAVETVPATAVLPDGLDHRGVSDGDAEPDSGRSLAQALARYEDAHTRWAVTAERALMARLEAGCAAPLGALARVERGRLVLDAVVLSVDGTRALRSTAAVELDGQSPGGGEQPTGQDPVVLEQARRLGVQVAEELLRDGAADLVHG